MPSSEDARDADNRDLISISHQAIIPSYNFTCDTVCGNITQWEVDIRGNGMNRMYTLDLQVWRPSPSAARDPSGSGCYSLVGNNKFTTTLGRGMMNVARFNPSPQDRIQFRPGDVLGFYVDGPGARGPSMNNVRVNALRTDRFTSELVWYGRITSPNSKNGNCPYTVGPNGDLSASTAAAPIISIKLTGASRVITITTIDNITFIPTAAASCPSLMPLATPLPLPPATNDQSLIPQSRTLRFPTTSGGVTDSQISTNIGLIVGIVIAVVALMLSTVVTMIVILLKIFREKAYGFNNPIEGQAISNIVYDTNLKGELKVYHDIFFISLREMLLITNAELLLIHKFQVIRAIL